MQVKDFCLLINELKMYIKILAHYLHIPPANFCDTKTLCAKLYAKPEDKHISINNIVHELKQPTNLSTPIR